MDQQINTTDMTRYDLEQFAWKAAAKLTLLQNKFEELQEALELSARVDPEVLLGWQAWIETLDQERNKWANSATRLSEQNTKLKDENKRIFQKLQELAEQIKQINRIAQENYNDKNKKKTGFQQGFKKIHTITQNALSKDDPNMLESEETSLEIEETA